MKKQNPKTKSTPKTEQDKPCRKTLTLVKSQHRSQQLTVHGQNQWLSVLM